MTKAKAATVTSALITAGDGIHEVAQANPADAASWYVVAFDPSGVTDVATVQTFATNNGVTASVDRVKFT